MGGSTQLSRLRYYGYRVKTGVPLADCVTATVTSALLNDRRADSPQPVAQRLLYGWEKERAQALQHLRDLAPDHRLTLLTASKDADISEAAVLAAILNR